MTQLDAVVLQPFGGPERSEDVVPVLDNVLRGRGVPESRKLEVAEHYRELGGTSPANACNRRFSAHVEAELRRRGRPLRLFLGNRNWHPLLPDTLAQMRDCGVGNAAVFVTSAFSSYSGCRQYQGDRERATATVDDAPALLPTAKFFNHPGFIEANADQVRAAIASLPPRPPYLRWSARRTVFRASWPIRRPMSSSFVLQPGCWQRRWGWRQHRWLGRVSAGRPTSLGSSPMSAIMWTRWLRRDATASWSRPLAF